MVGRRGGDELRLIQDSSPTYPIDLIRSFIHAIVVIRVVVITDRDDDCRTVHYYTYCTYSVRVL